MGGILSLRMLLQCPPLSDYASGVTDYLDCAPEVQSYLGETGPDNPVFTFLYDKPPIIYIAFVDIRLHNLVRA